MMRPRILSRTTVLRTITGAGLPLLGRHLARVKQRGFRGAEDHEPPPVYSATLSPSFLSRMRFISESWILKTARAMAEGTDQTIVSIAMKAALEHEDPAPSIDSLETTTLVEVAKKVNSIHTDKVLYVKTIYEPYRSVATHVLVEDEEGDVMMVGLYNYVARNQEPREVLPVGTHMALIAPYMKNSQDDRRRNLMLRCDNPSYVVQFDTEEDWMLSKAGMAFDDDSVDTTSFEDLMALADRALNERRYRHADSIYSRAIGLNPVSNKKVATCLLNRAQARLELRRFEDAESDSRRVLAHTTAADH